MILPNLNANGIFNGSNRKDLCKEYHAAYKAAKKAAEAFNSVHFHARDYETEQFFLARAKREEMARNLQEVIQYLERHTMELLEVE